MSILKHLLWLAILFPPVIASSSFAADFPAITPEDKAFTKVPQQPDAPAVILYREETTDDTKNFRTVYIRLKVLTSAGIKYADVEIPVEHDPFTISQLSGRTVHGDGSIVPLKDKPVDQIVLAKHGVPMHVKAFTLPDVGVGSILDYRYSLHFPEGSRNAPVWMVQSALFERRAVFKFVPTKYQAHNDPLRNPNVASQTIGSVTLTGDMPSYEQTGTTMGGEPVSEYTWVDHLPPGMEPKEHVTPAAAYKWVDLEVNDLAAVAQEPDMPPEAAVCWRVEMFYRDTAKPEDYWKSAGKAWNKEVENFLQRKTGISDAVSRIVAASDNPETKARTLYAAVTEMQNVSFAETAGVFQANTGADQVLQTRTGTHDELNRLFVAMVRAAGIPATMMWVPDRGRAVFDMNYMSTDQLDGEIAVVQLDGHDVFLDPGTKFCPYGVLNWHYAGVRGLRQSAGGGATLSDTPAPNYQQAVIERVARLQLMQNGSMQGTLAVGFSGQDAMLRRQSAIGMNAEGRKKLLEDEIGGWLPSGSKVALVNTPDWDGTETMLVAKFSVSGPVATNNGRTWVLPVRVFEANESPRFPADQRTGAIYFEYASRRLDEVHFILPSGVKVEALPPAGQAKTDYSIYNSETKREGSDGIVATRDLAMNNVLFSPAEYKTVKDFYDKVAADDAPPATLRSSLPKNP